MYLIKAQAHFDSAHFLSQYKGKCENIHGHRWVIEAQFSSEKLIDQGQLSGMVMDFKTAKTQLKTIADQYDHGFIYEKNSLPDTLIQEMLKMNFKLIEVTFRPTAERFAEHIFHLLRDNHYPVYQVTVYETPDNAASYYESQGVTS